MNSLKVKPTISQNNSNGRRENTSRFVGAGLLVGLEVLRMALANEEERLVRPLMALNCDILIGEQSTAYLGRSSFDIDFGNVRLNGRRDTKGDGGLWVMFKSSKL